MKTIRYAAPAESACDVFGMAKIKEEGAAIPFDPNAPKRPPATWRDRLAWRMRRLSSYFRGIWYAITGNRGT